MKGIMSSMDDLTKAHLLAGVRSAFNPVCPSCADSSLQGFHDIGHWHDDFEFTGSMLHELHRMEKSSSFDPKTNADTLRGWHGGNPAITTARVKFISEYLPRRETLQTPTFQSAALTETSHSGKRASRERVAAGYGEDDDRWKRPQTASRAP